MKHKTLQASNHPDYHYINVGIKTWITNLVAINNDSKPRGKGKSEKSRKLDLFIEKLLITSVSKPFTCSDSQIAVTRFAGSLQLTNSTDAKVSLF